MGTRWRIVAFGSAAGLVVAGLLFAFLMGGATGGAIGIGLLTLGLGGILLLLFFEVGLSEERDLAETAEGRRRRRAPRHIDSETRLGPGRRRRHR